MPLLWRWSSAKVPNLGAPWQSQLAGDSTHLDHTLDHLTDRNRRPPNPAAGTWITTDCPTDSTSPARSRTRMPPDRAARGSSTIGVGKLQTVPEGRGRPQRARDVSGTLVRLPRRGRFAGCAFRNARPVERV